MNETMKIPGCLERLRLTPDDVRAIVKRLGMEPRPQRPEFKPFVVGNRRLFQAAPKIETISIDAPPALSDNGNDDSINPPINQ